MIEKDDTSNFIVAIDNTDDVIRIVNNAFVFTFHDARIPTPTGTEIEQNRFVGPASTVLRFLTHKDGDLSTYFDKVDESENSTNNSTLNQRLIKNHITNFRRLVGGHTPLEYIFEFCKTLSKTAKSWM